VDAISASPNSTAWLFLYRRRYSPASRPTAASTATQFSASNRASKALYSDGRAPAQSSATLIAEIRIRESDRPSSIHPDTMALSLSRETSISMSESMRTVNGQPGGPALNPFEAAGFHRCCQRRLAGTSGCQRTSASRSYAFPGCRYTDPVLPVARVLKR